MHNHNNDRHKEILWVMMICCAVPLLLIILFGLGSKAFGAPMWVVIGGIAVMVVAHFFMMGRSHKHSNGEQTTTDAEDKNKNCKDHSGHKCCQ